MKQWASRRQFNDSETKKPRGNITGCSRVILSETIFCEGAPVGVVRQDSNSEQINFSPIKGKSPLSDQSWSSVDGLKAAVLEAYAHKEGGTSE